MKIFKLFGLATLTAAVALALVGSSSASAAQTVLCKVEESPCPIPNRWEMRPFEAKAEPFKLLTSLGTVECTSSTLNGTLGNSGEPQAVAIERLVFAGCKIGMTGCAVEAGGLGGLDLLRTNVNLGEGTLLNTEIKVQCSLTLNCTYEGAPVLHLLGKNGAEAAKLTANEVVMTKTGGLLCPTMTKLDATYTILVPLPVYIEF